MEGVGLLLNAEPRNKLAQLVNTYGGSASVALLDPNCQLFTIPEVDGVIGYRSIKGCAVVFGDPVCSLYDMPKLSQAFHTQSNHSSVIYVTASEAFSTWALNCVCKGKIETEEELVLNPQNDPTIGPDAHQLRKKLNRAREAHITVEEYLGHNPKLEEALKGVVANWLDGRSGPQIFMAKVDLTFDLGKRWFFARSEGKLWGTLILHKMDARKGWLIHMVMLEPNAPQGTSETLVVEALKTLANEGCTFATFGATPKKEVGEVDGLKPFSAYVGRKGFNLSKRFFDLDNRRKYWEKYKPQSEKCYILFSKNSIGWREVVGILRAFNVSL